MTTQAIQRVEAVAMDGMGGVKWTRDLVELCKRTVCPKGISDDEFALFMQQCSATGFNPFTKEAFCVPRKVKGPSGDYVTLHVFQPSVEGARARAGRFADFHSSTSAAVHANDQCVVDVDAGKVQHSFTPTKPRGVIVGAWGKVTKRGGDPVVVWLPAGARAGNSQFWTADPGGMLGKCAEMAALRKAYPVQLAGVHLREEQEDYDAPPTHAARVLSDAPPAVESLPPSAPKPSVAFGEWKGRHIEALTHEECSAALAFAEEKMTEQPKAKWVKAMRENAEAIRAHRDSLVKSLPADTAEADFIPSEPTEEQKAAILASEMEGQP